MQGTNQDLPLVPSDAVTGRTFRASPAPYMHHRSKSPVTHTLYGVLAVEPAVSSRQNGPAGRSEMLRLKTLVNCHRDIFELSQGLHRQSDPLSLLRRVPRGRPLRIHRCLRSNPFCNDATGITCRKENSKLLAYRRGNCT